MLLRGLVFASLLLPTPSSLVLTEPTDYVIPSQAIVQVVCLAPDKNPMFTDISSGTAFRIGKLFLSVRHVTNAPGKCSIGKNPLKIVYSTPEADFAMLDADKGPFLQIDCGGFVEGRKYMAYGFGRGQSELTPIELTATGVNERGMSRLYGMFSVIPGMSGGPIVSEDTGKVVGTVNAENFEAGFSWSVPLSSTPVCKRSLA